MAADCGHTGSISESVSNNIWSEMVHDGPYMPVMFDLACCVAVRVE
jgi:hypothetical protein